MTNINENLEDELDLEDEDEDDYLFDDDDWEDSAFPAKIATQYPGWHQLKIVNFNYSRLVEVKAWCAENVTNGRWEQVGWRSGCSTSVGIVIESARDAMMFKLRWS